MAAVCFVLGGNMLKGWERSKGAMIEKTYAEYQGKEVFYEE